MPCLPGLVSRAQVWHQAARLADFNKGIIAGNQIKNLPISIDKVKVYMNVGFTLFRLDFLYFVVQF